jgi:hypothetical protein
MHARHEDGGEWIAERGKRGHRGTVITVLRETEGSGTPSFSPRFLLF